MTDQRNDAGATDRAQTTATRPGVSGATAGVAPMIRRLSITRFRGVSALTWRPGPGVNLILGGGDVGKTTILDAIGLVLSPVNPVEQWVPLTDERRRMPQITIVRDISSCWGCNTTYRWACAAAIT